MADVVSNQVKLIDREKLAEWILIFQSGQNQNLILD